MKTLKFSDGFEINMIGENSVIYSQDFSQVFHAGQIESLILREFVSPKCVSEVKAKMQSIQGFTESEFNNFVNDLINKKILVFYEE